MELKKRKARQNRSETDTDTDRGVVASRRLSGAWAWAWTHLEEIDAAIAPLFLGALHSLDAFPDSIFDPCACEVSWWRGTEDTPFCGAKDLFGDVGGK